MKSNIAFFSTSLGPMCLSIKLSCLGQSLSRDEVHRFTTANCAPVLACVCVIWVFMRPLFPIPETHRIRYILYEAIDTRKNHCQTISLLFFFIDHQDLRTPRRLRQFKRVAELVPLNDVNCNRQALRGKVS